jgi:hypothetical protein
MTRRRAAVLIVVSAASAGFTVLVSHTVATRYARRYAERSALSIAAYLALVTPPSADRSDYALPPLLIRARALDLVPEWASQVEVYRGTAPLVRATARTLPPATLDRLRRLEVVEWRDDDVLVPLTDGDLWNVVGAVAVRVPEPGPGWFGGFALPALLMTLVALAVYMHALARNAALRPRAHSFYWMTALVLGVVAVSDVVRSAHGSTERWLSGTRTLIQEAVRAPSRPDLADLALIARGATLVPRGAAAPVRGEARIAVRLAAGRWAELRTQKPVTGGWVLALLLLAVVGPALLSAHGLRGRTSAELSVS